MLTDFNFRKHCALDTTNKIEFKLSNELYIIPQTEQNELFSRHIFICYNYN